MCRARGGGNSRERNGQRPFEVFSPHSFASLCALLALHSIRARLRTGLSLNLLSPLLVISAARDATPRSSSVEAVLFHKLFRDDMLESDTTKTTTGLPNIRYATTAVRPKLGDGCRRARLAF